MAREIHDTLLQGVTGIAIQLRAVLPDVQTAPDAATTVLESIVELAERTSRDARQAVWDMRTTKHTRRDLAESLEVTGRRLTAGSKIRVRVSASGSARALRPDRHAAVVRIVQEAIANVVRHARARNLRLELGFEANHLCVHVIDDGIGFSVAKDFRSYERHWGLVGMEERARNLGGALVVDSTLDVGTTVSLRLPY